MNNPQTLILKGSPNIQSNSLRLAAAMLEVLGGEHRIVDLYKVPVAPCTACSSCYNGESCPIDDAMPAIMTFIDSADVVILASPLHFTSLTAPVVAFLSRLQFAWQAKQRGERILSERFRQGILVLTGGADYHDMFRPARAVAVAAFNSLGIPLVGMAKAVNTDIVSVNDNKAALVEAQMLAATVREGYKSRAG